MIRTYHISFTTLFSIGLFFYLNLPSTASADSSLVPDNGVAPYTVQLTATVQENPPSITLTWPREASSTVVNYVVYRKTAAATAWGSARATLSSTTLSYTDVNVSTSTTYEYRVSKQTASTTGYGYIYSGIKAPLQDTRGKVILIVDDSKTSALSSELTRLQQDLANEGWTVIRHDVASTSSVVSIKALITADYQADTANVKQVFLFGRIPVPYSGDSAMDGHGDHVGAWPADTYYGSMSGNWTDSTVNDSGASDPRNHNIPGDGKFDQTFIPATLSLAVGRVDLSNLPAFAPNTETDLLRQYLNKDHQYRIKGSIVPLNQGLISGNFGAFEGEAFSGSGWTNLSVLVGGSNIISTFTPPIYSYFEQLASTTFLWAEGDGAGTFTSAYGGVGSTNDFASNTPRAVFNMFFGSYFGDWDSTNNFLRAPLASAGWGLTSVWSGRPWWVFNHMGMGEPIGYDMLTTLNNTGTYFTNFPYGGAYENLMGDPTLHMYVMTPSGSITASSTERTTDLSWASSPDATAGYHVYRASSAYGPYTRLTTSPVVDTTYTAHATSTGTYYYMSRAIRLETTPSGTFWNASPGITTGPLSITVINTPPAISPISDQSGYINATTSVTVNLSDGESDVSALTVSASSSEPTTISASGLSFTGSGASRTLRLRAQNHVTGSSTITVTVSDGQASTSTSFVYTILDIADTVAPSVPTHLSGTLTGASTAHLNWSASTDTGSSTGDVSGVDHYVIYSNGALITTTQGTSYDKTDLPSGAAYSFSVSAVDGTGNESSQSSSVTVTVPSRSSGSNGGSYSPTVFTPTALQVQPNLTTQPLPNTKQVITQTMGVGSEGAHVLTLQKILHDLGFLSVTPNGYFGPATKRAVAAYQIAHKLPAIGVVGPLTLATLNASQSPVPAPITAPTQTIISKTISIGSKGADILALQKFLNGKGYIVAATGPGSPNNETTLFGQKTKDALMLFQSDHNIPATGILDDQVRTLISSLSQ